tara:strand:+ start:585 stop:1271 length:687 start_codon:yes stop_codon:yes gene_type:complete
MLKKLKIIARNTQEFLERYILGNFFQALVWRSKHIYQPKWTKTSLTSLDLLHRNQLTLSIASLKNNDSILEIGCAAGPNLRLLREKLPNSNLFGIDINNQAIREAQKYFGSMNDNKVFLSSRQAHHLDIFEDKNFDVVFSQAVMVCIPPPTFNRTIEQILRVTKKTIIFNEYHKDGAVDGFFDQGRWVYDYRSIIKKYYPDAVICINNTDFKGGSWDIYGKLITITLT